MTASAARTDVSENVPGSSLQYRCLLTGQAERQEYHSTMKPVTTAFLGYGEKRALNRTLDVSNRPRIMALRWESMT